MQIIKLLLFTLVFCLCSFLSAQNPALLTRYTWNADTDSWQQQFREIHTQAAPQQEVVLAQIWDATQRAWIDWTRTTTDFNEAGQAISSLTEKMKAGEYVNVLKKEFSFDTAGDLLTQVDQRWDARSGNWLNLYEEIRKYSPQFGEQVGTLNERIIMRPDANQLGWEKEEKYVSFQFAVGDGVQHFSRRHIWIEGVPVIQDQLVTRVTDNGKEETLMEGNVGNWTPVSKKVTTVDEFTSSVLCYTFSNLTQTWEETAFKNTSFNERGDIRNILENKMNTTFTYDAKGRVKEILRQNPISTEQFVHDTRTCGSRQNLSQEVADANIFKEVYSYEDQFELSYEMAQFDMVLFPNPMQHFVQLKLSEWVPGTRVVKVMDLQGRLIKQESFDSSSHMQLGRRDLTAGTYIVQLISSQGVKTARLVVAD